MLTGRLPYGAAGREGPNASQQRKLRYASALDDDREIPAWIDEVLKKAVHPDPYEALRGAVRIRATSCAIPTGLSRRRASTPLIERNPLLFWKCVSAILAVIVVALLFARHVR